MEHENSKLDKMLEQRKQEDFEMMADKLDRYLGMKIKMDSRDHRGQK